MGKMNKFLPVLLAMSAFALAGTVYGNPVPTSSATPTPTPTPVAAHDSSATAYDNPTPTPTLVVAAHDSPATAYDNPTPIPTLVVAAHDSLHPEGADFVCDGFNDQAEIQAAIDALPAGGGRVLLLDGTFYISSTILADHYTTLEGKGYDTLLYLVDNSNCDVISNKGGYDYWRTNVTIRNLRIDGNKNNQSDGSGINRTGYNALYQNLGIESCFREGISHLWGDYTKILNNTVFNCDGTGIFLGETQKGEVVGNKVYNCGLTPEGDQHRGIFVWAGEHNKINYNEIDGGGYSSQIGTWDSPYCEIKGNRLVNGLYMGIHTASQYSRVIENDIIDCGENAIDTCLRSDCWIEGNFVHGVFGPEREGVLKEHQGVCISGNRTTVINNIFEFCGNAGIYADAVTDAHILNNTIRNCGQGGGGGRAGIWVHIWDPGTVNTGTVIRGNKCFDDQDIPTQLYGIMLHASLGYIDDIIIQDNDLRNNGTAGINSYSATNVRNCIIRNNLGIE